MNLKQNVYLNLKTLSEAREILSDAFLPVDFNAKEELPVTAAVGRVLADAVTAIVSAPNFHSAVTDGIAVKAKDTFGAHENRPKRLQIDNQAFYVNSGHVLPENTDSVILIEHVQVADEKTVVVETPVVPWQYVRKAGEAIEAADLLFPCNHLITPYCVGALISSGIYQVCVRKRPKVLIIPTGSEVVDWRTTDPSDLKPGQILESNSAVLGLMVNGCGGDYCIHEGVMDDTEKIHALIKDAVADEYQIVLIIGGSSAGSEKFSKQAITALGEVLVHGVAIRPGKPVLFGKVEATPVFGIPGNPVSAIVAFEQFVQPLLYAMQGHREPERPALAVTPTRKIPSKPGIEEFIRVKLGRVGEKVVATPLSRGTEMITSLTEADGIIRIPNHIESIKERQIIMAELLKPIEDIEDTLVVVGSHDHTLDILADELKIQDARLTLSSSHVGSIGGLMAIRRGTCHLAGSHLLDTKDGTYNLYYVRQIFKNIPVKLVHLVMREQGLIIPKGNPKKIHGIEDLAGEEIIFINRQKGSSTRVLLDFHLSRLGMTPNQIKGYDSEKYNHKSVAVAVANGMADVGLGIYAAAQAFDLDFIPMATEQYDLVIPGRYYVMPNMQILLETITTSRFKERVEKLGGYSTECTGTILM
jgi:putative molybdopterin biosynthesis protein